MTARRVAVIAGASAAAAEAAARREGFDPALVLTGPEVMRLGRRFRSEIRASGVHGLAVHTRAWSRQVYPHAYELVLALAPVDERYLIDDEREKVVRLAGSQRVAAVGRLPVDAVRGALSTRAETRRLRRNADGTDLANSTAHQPAGRSMPEHPDGEWVIAVWRSSPETGVGGSISHITGILSGFRRLGLRVALLSDSEPPEQVAAVIDQVAIVPALHSSARITRDAERLNVNRTFRETGITLARRVRPVFLYQRHEYLMSAGADIARECGIPFALEWNASETAEIVRSWMNPGPLDRRLDGFFGPLATSAEKYTVAWADLVAAVSDHAADMAYEVGAGRAQVEVVPNGVDVDVVRPVRIDGASPTGPVELGWIGSFGPWHGAEIAVRALAALPEHVRLVMIGDGSERSRCVRLAKELNLADRVEWTGSMPHAEALARLGRADILVSPHVAPEDGSPFFGSPTKIFEYLALGRPIVASRLEQIGEVLRHGSTALLVTPGDVGELVRAILDVMALPDRGQAMAQAARADAEQHHTWEARAAAIYSGVRARTAAAERG